MSTWDSTKVNYGSFAFRAGHDDGAAGKEASPSAEYGEAEYASYMEGWLMGREEQGI